MVSTTHTHIDYQVDPASTGPFEITFFFLDISHIQLFLDGDEIPVSDYTVTRNQDGLGEVVLTSQVTGVLSVHRNTPLVQETDYIENDDLSGETLERDQDRAILIDQEQNTVLDRTLTLPPGTLPSDITNSTVGYNSSGDLVTRSPQEQVEHLGLEEVLSCLSDLKARVAALEGNTPPPVNLGITIGGQPVQSGGQNLTSGQ